MSQQHSLTTSQILKFTCFCLLAGKAYEHFFFEPYYSMFSPAAVPNMLLFSATLFLIAAVLSLLASPKRKWIIPVLLLTTVNLFLQTWSSYERTNYVLAQLIEHTLQTVTPLLLIMAVYLPQTKRLDIACKVAIALTFTGHGLFALGVYPVPPHFIAMFNETLGVSSNTAVVLLFIAGSLDLVVSVLLFVPRFAKYAATYAVFWGFLTAFARLTSYVQTGPMFWLTLHQNFFKFLVRVPHFMVPFTQLKQKVFKINRKPAATEIAV